METEDLLRCSKRTASDCYHKQCLNAHAAHSIQFYSIIIWLSK